MSFKLLAIDTTDDACSVALFNQEVIQQHYQLAPRQHTHLILPMLQSLLDEAKLTLRDLQALAFGCGPGSFTGIRLAASIIQAIAASTHLPVIPVSSLQCLAQGLYREFQIKKVLAAIDAHMNEVYWNSYVLGVEDRMIACGSEQLSDPRQVPLRRFTDFIGAGSAWDRYPEMLVPLSKNHLQAYYPQRYPKAYDVALIAVDCYRRGQVISAEAALPVYLRETVVLNRGPNG